jgi:hypothetical protein
MSGFSAEEAITIQQAVAGALKDADIADNSPIAAVLARDSELHDGMISVCDPEGRSVSLTQRLEQMRTESRWRSEFPAKPGLPGRPAPMPAGSILTPTRESFAKIVAGETVVR